MASAVVIVPIGLLIVLGAELLVGLLVLERGGGRLAARFLGAFMILHAMTFGVISAWQVSSEFFGTNLTDSTIVFDLILFNFLPMLLLAFALTYPDPPRWLRERSWILALPFLYPVGLLALFFLDPMAARAGTGPGGVPITILTFLGGLFAVALAAAGIFWTRRRRATTELKARRLAFMAKVVAIPFAVLGAVAGIVFTFVPVGGPFEPLTHTMLSLLALVPAAGLGYGVLRYRILDLDLKLKRGIKGSTLAASFIAVFFIVSEGAQVVLAGVADSELVGVIAAGALVFVLSPLQRLASKVSDTAMPGVEDTPEHRAHRRTEVYRATLEEVLADGQMSTKDRRVLLSLQETLGLDGNEASQLEREVLEAVAGGEPSSQPGPGGG